MNILIPHSWLREHLDTQATPRKIQKCLSLCGPTVEKIEKVNGEAVYDIEITTNRVDTMSVRGIAREAAAILPQFGIKASLKPLVLPKIPTTSLSDHFNTLDHPTKANLGIAIKNDPKLCHRILAVKLEKVKLGPSPNWLQNRLHQVGQRPLNNAIDITNFVMWELGHPMHAFDYDRLTQKTIIVREAQKGETLITLDNKKITLVGGEVVFDDGTGKIVDLPGIMGTKNSVVNSNTNNVLLWIESIDSSRIRHASLTHSLRSQAAILNEKQVDPELGMPAMRRGIDLFKKITGAKPASKLIDIYPNQPRIKSTSLDQSLVDTYLGVKLKPQTITSILKSLGCAVKVRQLATGRQKSSFHITPPSWRANDLNIAQDYIEEIARIYGYHNLPSTIMATAIPDNPPDEDFHLEHSLKTWLAGWGFTEVYTYSMVSKAQAKMSGYPLKNHLKLKNPLISEWVYLRRSLIPSLLQVINQNKNRDQISIFEMANVYHPQKKSLPQEELQLTLVTTQDYRHLKGIADLLGQKLHLKDFHFIPQKKPPKIFAPQKTAAILSGKTCLGYIGQVSQSSTFALNLLVTPLLKLSSRHPRYLPAITTPPIIEDLTFTLPAKTYVGEVIDEIYAVSNLIEKVQLKNIFKHNYSFSISYRSPKQSLTDSQIAPIRQKIVKNLQQSFKAKLKGKV